MNKDLNEIISQCGVKTPQDWVKKRLPSKNTKSNIKEKAYYCFTCEFGTNNKKD